MISFIVRATHEEGPTEEDLCEEIIVAFHAATQEEALAQACDFVKKQEIEYRNVNEGIVRWRFMGFAGITEEDGVSLTASHSEVFSRFLSLKCARMLCEEMSQGKEAD